MEAHRPGLVRTLAAAGLAGALVLACLGGVSGAAAQTKERPITVSLADLVVDKQAHKGKLVRVRGYIAIGREMQALYPSEEEANSLNSDDKKAIWLNLSNDEHDGYRRFSRTFGYVTGRFRAGDCEGHMCAFGGSLDEVTIRAR
jgi:hypothetical protein